MKRLRRPPSGACNLAMYMGFLISEPKHSNCSRLAEVVAISHDSVNRFLAREVYEPKDLFDEAKQLVNSEGGTLSADDTVLDKPYGFKVELVGHFWSGKHHKSVKGINLITMYYTDPQGRSVPVNYRVYDKTDGKTKNDYFQQMLTEVLAWGLKPAFVTADSWYSCIKNLKHVKNHGMGFMFAIETNRLVSVQKGQWIQVQMLDIPIDGRIVWLREFGQVKLFRTRLKDQLRHYVVYLPQQDQDDDPPTPRQNDAYDSFTAAAFLSIHDEHWKIEQYHRTIKQICHIEHFHVRGKQLILNHIFASLCSFVYLQKMQFSELIKNAYQWNRSLFSTVVAAFVQTFVSDHPNLKPHFSPCVNA